MALGYYLQDYPNPNTPQYGWLRVTLTQLGQRLSGVIGVHTSEAITDFEGVDNNAENNAAFIGRRTDYGSYHTTADADSILPLVHPAWAAWADTTNNAHAMSVSGCLQAARWLEMTPARRRAVVVNMAHAAARMVQTAVADGYLASPTPARRITAAEAISGSRPGFYGHGETNPGTRYDPGQHFDWDLFLTTYAQAIGGAATGPTTPPNQVDQEDTLSAAEVNKIIDAIEAEGKATRKYVGQLLVFGYTVGDKAFPGIAAVNIETQKRVTQLPRKILRDTKVKRDGKEVSVIQEIADAKTFAAAGLSAVDLERIGEQFLVVLEEAEIILPLEEELTKAPANTTALQD